MSAESPDTIKRFFRIGADAAEKSIEAVADFSASNDDEYAHKASTILLFAKGYKTYQAMRILFEQGFGEDAMTLLRTLFDLMLQAVWIHRCPKPRGRRFLLHERVAQYLLYERHKKSGDDPEIVKYLESRGDDLARLKEDFDRFKHDYASKGKKSKAKHKKVPSKDEKVRIHDHWWCGTIGDLARWLGPNYQKQYANLYPVASGYVHSDVHSVGTFIEANPKGWKVNCRPSAPTRPASLAPMFATSWLLEILGALNAAYTAGLDEYLARAAGEVSRIALE